MAIPDAARALDRDLRGIFGSRLQSLVVYGLHAAHDGGAHGDAHAHGAHRAAPTRTLAIAASLTLDDLRAIARHVERWHDAGLATPLVLEADEFGRSLDVFPLEFGAIIADHAVVSGDNPFASLQVDAADVRRACEVQARSHLLHLREGFLETRGRDDALSLLIVESAPAFAALVTSLARLGGAPRSHGSGGALDGDAAARQVERTIGVTDGTVAAVVGLARAHDLPSAEGARLFAPYLDAVEKIVRYVDGWRDER
jgi:hypothetical protein